MRDATSIRDVCSLAGVVLPAERGRHWCPVHGNAGSNPQAFVYERNRAHCFSRCARSWDPISLAMDLLRIDFKAALRICADSNGIRGGYVSAASIARGRRERQAEDDRRAAIEADYVRAWLAEIEILDRARDDQVLMRCLYRDNDRDSSKRNTALMLDRIGDPYVVEAVALERVAALEDEWRSWRTQSGYSPTKSWGLRVLEGTMSAADHERGMDILNNMIEQGRRSAASAKGRR